MRSIYDEFSQKRKQAEALQADKEDEDDSFVQITTQIKELTQ